MFFFKGQGVNVVETVWDSDRQLGGLRPSEQAQPIPLAGSNVGQLWSANRDRGTKRNLIYCVISENASKLKH